MRASRTAASSGNATWCDAADEMRYALRSLLNAREFTVVAVAVIAIGIGANVAVFSIVDASLLRPLPFADAERLFMLAGVNPKRGIDGASFSYPAFVELAARDRGRTALAAIAAVANEQFNSTGDQQPEQLAGARVSAAFFDLLGVRASIGRTFVASEDAPGGPNVAVLGRRYWMRRFAGSATAAGATLTLNGAPYTVVGALGIDMPPPFDDVDVWATRVDEVGAFTRAQINGGLGYLTAVARLRPAARVEQAQAEVDAIARAYARAHPVNTDADPDASLRLVPIRERTVGSTRSPLLVLMGAVGLVLLVACANVANLLRVRAAARTHEAAVRVALGASRRDLTRWLCSESIVLALAGGCAGALLAFWGVGLARSALDGLPRGSEIAVNARALLFSLAVSLTAGIVFGLVPSTLLGRQAPVDALKGVGPRATSRRGAAGALVIAEVALTLMLLVAAGLLLQSFTRLTRVPVGFRPDGLLTMRVSMPASQYVDPAAMRSFMTRLIPRLESLPGVAAAAATMALPPTITTMAPYIAGNEPMVAVGERPVGQWSGITPGYFATMGIPLVAGRRFTERDDEEAPLAVIVSQSLARRVWPDESPIGRTLLVGRFPGFAEVVGVVGDVKNNGLANEPVLAMYTPYAQRPWPAMQFAVRVEGGDPLAFANAVRAAVLEVDRNLPITRVETMDAALSDSIATARLMTSLLIAFAAVALVMAAAGLYGVISYTVAQRTQEIGVRVALGAEPRAVIRLIAVDGLRLTAIGMAIGTGAALAAARALRSVLFAVSPADPATYAAVLAIFAATAGAALVIPARRALAVDPLTALRAE
jgi:putative ABC transport system permease protein